MTTVLFGPDTYTVGANSDINAYPGPADYAYSRGSGSDIQVIAATDNLLCNIAASKVARVVNASVPSAMGNQLVRCNVNCPAGCEAGGALRYSTTTRGYEGMIVTSATNEVTIYEDNAGLTLLADADRSLVADTTYPVVFSALGGTAECNLRLVINSTAAVTFRDTTAPATGTPGVYMFGNGAKLDDLQVERVIEYFGSASTPADGAAAVGTGPGPITITVPGSMLTGDLVVVDGQYKATGVTFSVVNAGGQTWNTLAEYSEASGIEGNLFWCTFNGTWSASPTFQINAGILALTFVMHVFRPSVGTKVWAVDVAQSEVDFIAAASPSITGQSPTVPDTVTVAAWHTSDDNTWGTLSGTNWAVTGTAQYRNTTGNDQSSSYAHIIQYETAATGNVTKTQLSLGNDAGVSVIVTFREEDPVVGGATHPGWYQTLGGWW